MLKDIGFFDEIKGETWKEKVMSIFINRDLEQAKLVTNLLYRDYLQLMQVTNPEIMRYLNKLKIITQN